jgi:hypothetical protein
MLLVSRSLPAPVPKEETTYSLLKNCSVSKKPKDLKESTLRAVLVDGLLEEPGRGKFEDRMASGRIDIVIERVVC